MPNSKEHSDSNKHDVVGISPVERDELVPDLLARRFAGDSRSYWGIVWDDFRARRPALIALWVFGFMAVICVLAPYLANHRPFVLNIPKDIAASIGATNESLIGLHFPLFASLGYADWLLTFGALLIITTFIAARRAKKRKDRAARLSLSFVLLAVLLPPLVALTFSPAVRSIFSDCNGQALLTVGWLGEPVWKWLVFGGISLIGLLLTGLLGVQLWTGARDDLGNLNTGSRLFGVLMGGIMLLLGSAWLGTMGQRELDTTDYHALAEHAEVFSIFPVVEQDFLASESYIKNQSPLGPFTRVQPSGGSLAASDLGLSDLRKAISLATENGPDASVESPNPITPDTLLAVLRKGDGVRKHDDFIKDFTLVSHSLERYAVFLNDAQTIGDVINEINSATGGVVTAKISDDDSRLELIDNGRKRPTNYLGTDSAGYDIASRLIRATRVALSIGFVSTGVALFIGVIMGSLMGYFGGWVDMVGMRIIEIFMAIPRLFLLLTVIAIIPPELNKYMLYAMMAVIGATTWMTSARFIRAEFFRLRDQDFVQAAKASGLPVRSILFKHMLPNGVTPVLVDASFGVAAAIFIETGLSFLGFGIKPPNPSWGQMLAEAVDPATGVFYWWLAIFPGIMIFLTVFAFNLIGDALRDAIDPKLKKAAH